MKKIIIMLITALATSTVSAQLQVEKNKQAANRVIFEYNKKGSYLKIQEGGRVGYFVDFNDVLSGSTSTFILKDRQSVLDFTSLLNKLYNDKNPEEKYNFQTPGGGYVGLEWGEDNITIMLATDTRGHIGKLSEDLVRHINLSDL